MATGQGLPPHNPKQKKDQLPFAANSADGLFAAHHFWLKPVAGIVIKLGLIIIMLASIMGIALSVYVIQAGGLKQLIEDELSFEAQAINTNISDITIRFFDEGAIAAIILSDTKMRVGDQSLHLPEMRIDSTVSSWFEGRFWQIELSALTLDLVQDGDGFQLSGDFAQALNHLSAPEGRQNGQPKRAIAPLAILANRQLALSNSIVRLRKTQDEALVQFDDVALTLVYDEPVGLIMSGSASQSLMPAAGQAGTLSFDAVSNLRSGLSEVSMRTTALDLSAIAAFVPPAMAPLMNAGALDSQLTLLLDGASLQTGAGRLVTTGGRLPNGAALEEVQSQFSYSRVDDYLSISSLSLRLQDGQSLAISGDMRGVSQPQSYFDGTLTLTDTPVDDLLSNWPEFALPDVRSYMISSFSGGNFETIALAFAGQYEAETSALSLSALSLQGDVKNLRVETKAGHYSQLVGTANGMVSIEVVSGGLLKNAKANLQLRDGYLTTKGGDAALGFETMSGDVFYQPGQLQVPNLAVTFDDGSMLASDITIDFNEERALSGATISLTSDGIALPILTQLMPPEAMRDVSAYLRKNIIGGQLSQTDINLSLQAQEQGYQLTAIGGRARLDEVSAIYMTGQEALDNISAQLAFADNALVIDLVTDGTSHQAQHFDVAAASVTIAPLILSEGAPSRRVELIADASAALPQILPLMNAPQIALQDRLAQDVPMRLDEATGALRARLQMGGEIITGKPLAFEIMRLDGVITDGNALAFYKGHNLADAEIVFGYDGTRFDASGSATLDDVSGTFSVTRQGDVLSVKAQIPPQRALAQLAGTLSSQEIGGALGGRVTLETKDNGQTVEAVISADVTGASIHVPALNWTKLQRETGRAVGHFSFADGQLKVIDDITIEAGDLRGTGQIVMTDKGRFASAQFADLAWAGNQINTLSVATIREAQDSERLSVTAEGPRINLRHLRSGEQETAGLAVQFDVTSERLMIDDDVSLFGQLTGNITQSGDGKARLQGALLYEGEPLLEEGTVNAVFGPNGEYLSAVGLIGGAEARMEYSPLEEGGSVLIINTQNAGRVLSGLNITDTIRSGRMALVNQFTADGFDDYDTHIRLEEFNVIEAPAAVRAFSVLGLAGLYALVEGDGTKFTLGAAQIETRGAQHKITKLTASGGAVGLSMVGDYNSETRQVDVSGNLVPVNQFSKIIGAVPLLGDLLAGIDNAGIFATQFNVKGDIDDPETTINAASLVPGVLRDIFSPDWLGRERDRLFGKTNESDNLSENQSDNRTSATPQ